MPQTATTSGSIGTTSVYGTTTYYQEVPYTATCLIRIIAADNGRILSWETQGSAAACPHWIDRLAEYHRANRPRGDDWSEREFDNLIVPPGVTYAEYMALKMRCREATETLMCFYQAVYKLGDPPKLSMKHLETWQKKNFANEPLFWSTD